MAFCVIGVILLYIGAASAYIGADYYEWTTYDTSAAILIPLGLYLTIHGSYLWAREKGRSGWWCLIALIAPIGYLVLMSLKDKSSISVSIEQQPIQTESMHFCPNCGKKLKEETLYCPNCAAELSSFE